jgi:serine/threonine-protein kinase TNNI3K
MAPEVAKMDESYGFPADVYSFSILLWQIVTKRIPYGHITSPTEFAAKVVKGNQRPNLAYVECESLRDIVENGWTTDPAARHSFSEIREKLDNYICRQDQEFQQTSIVKQKSWSWNRTSGRSDPVQQPRRNIGGGTLDPLLSSQISRQEIG